MTRNSIPPQGWARGRRRVQRSLPVAMTMLVAVVLPATAATAPSGYTTVSGWSYSGSSGTATLPSPYSGTVTVSSQSGQVAQASPVVSNAVNVIPDPSTGHPLYDCMASTLASAGFVKQCNTYSETITFSSPVTNPVLSLRGGGGHWVSPDGTQCVLGYTSSASVTAVNGGSSTGLVSLASPLDSGLSFSGSTISRASSQISGCGASNGTNVWGLEYLQVSGTVTSVTITYVMSAKVTQNPTNIAFQGWVPAWDYGGLTTAVLLPPVQSDLSVTKTADLSSGIVGSAITWTIVVTNNGPDVAPSWTLSDPVPAGFTNPATTTPGCTINSGTLTCSGTNLGVHQSRTITMTGTAGTAGTVTNTATVSTTATDPNSGNNSATASVTIVQGPLFDLRVLGVLGLIGLVIGGYLVRRRLSNG